MPGEFFVTGFAAQLLSNAGPVQDSAILEGLTGSFISNIPRGQPVPVDGGIVWVPARDWVIGADGQFHELLPDGTMKATPGITLTAHDPAFELTNPLQWQVKPDRFTLAGATRPIGLTPWWFNAPAPGWTGSIDQLTPVPGVDQKGGTRGLRGYRSRLRRVPDSSDPPEYQWQDESGALWTDPEPYTEIFADSLAEAAPAAIPGAAADYFETLTPQVVDDPDNPGYVRLKIGEAVGPGRPGTATTIELITDAEETGKELVRSPTPNSARNVLDVPSLVQQGTAGRLVIMLDDGFVSHIDAIAEADKRGHKLNLALTQDLIGTGGKMNSLQVRQAAMRGHGILCHSKTHPNLTSVDDPTLWDEMALPLRQFSSLIGRKSSEIDMVYPQSAKNLKTLSAGYGRYRRQYAGRFSTEPWRTPFWRSKPHLCGRFNWATDNQTDDRHTKTKAEIIAAATANEDLVIYTHATDGSAANGVTMAEFKEVLDLAMRLGMKVVTVDEFQRPNVALFGTSNFGVVDHSFEDVASFGSNFQILAGATGTAQIVDTPPAGPVYVPGTDPAVLKGYLTAGARALRISRNAIAQTGSIVVEQVFRVPLLPWAEIEAPVILSARVKANVTTAAVGGGLTIRVMCANADGVVAGASAFSPVLGSTADWSAAGGFKTVELSYAQYVNFPFIVLRYVVANALGDFYIDHVQLSRGSADSFS